jgi:hypothetical protein
MELNPSEPGRDVLSQNVKDVLCPSIAACVVCHPASEKPALRYYNGARI